MAKMQKTRITTKLCYYTPETLIEKITNCGALSYLKIEQTENSIQSECEVTVEFNCAKDAIKFLQSVNIMEEQ